MPGARVIKRYSNRKLYDTQGSRYVTLEQVAEMIRCGDEVTIVDNNSKEDLTSVTLAQIILEQEKKQRSFLSLNAMRNIIQLGGERIEELMSHAQKKVSGVFLRGREKDRGALGGDRATEEASSTDLPAAADPKEGLRALREFREWLEGSQRTIDEWQKRVDDRIRHVVEGISPFASLQREVTVLAARINDLEKKLEQIEPEDPGPGSGTS